MIQAVEEDMRLISNISPHVVVGDGRLSLTVSAPLAKVPHVGICGAHWSPHWRHPLPLVDPFQLGGILLKLGKRLRRRAAGRLVLPGRCQMVNGLREALGLPSLDWDARRLETHADLTLFADVPELVRDDPLEPHQRFLGPVLWERTTSQPWQAPGPEGRPLVYVCLGSSGTPRLLRCVLRALAELDVTVVVATEGRFKLGWRPENTWAAPLLPERQVAAQASLVVTHGESASSYQALAAEAPVLCLPRSLDQSLSALGFEGWGAARTLPAEQATPARVRSLAEHLLHDPDASLAACQMARVIARYDAPRSFAAELDELLDVRPLRRAG
jgi:UDP:flavonoid glycosyltransferase YjiC (YdhE family)